MAVDPIQSTHTEQSSAECRSPSCRCADPENQVIRSLKGIDWYGIYCKKHDPMDDPGAHDHWEVADDGDW